MNIQSNINQTLSLVGALAQMNPELVAAQEKRNTIKELERAEAKIGVQQEQSMTAHQEAAKRAKREARIPGKEGVYEYTPEHKAREQIYQEEQEELSQARLDILEQLYETDPSEERFKALHELKVGFAERDIKAAERRKAQESREARRKAFLESRREQASLTRQEEVAKSRRIASIIEGIPSTQPDPRGTAEERASHLASIKKSTEGEK